jgi:hypothetical protein
MFGFFKIFSIFTTPTFKPDVIKWQCLRILNRITMMNVPRFAKFRAGEVLQFAYDILKICNKYNPDQLQITLQVSALTAGVQTMDSIFKSDTASAYNEELLAADLMRDDDITGIRTCVLGYTYHYDPAISAAADLLLKSIDKYGSGIARMNYQSETSTLTSLFNDWASDSKLTNALSVLNMQAWANRMQSDNARFNDVFISRVGEASSAPQEVASSFRLTLITQYRTLIKQIEARNELDSENRYTALVGEINELINKYNTLVGSRSVSKPTDTQAAAK